jgi:hypothetical protein|tara:strand:+ start:2532 stop:3314 length:783 start_codon:yes stop_codon:yes gene_type:complete
MSEQEEVANADEVDMIEPLEDEEVNEDEAVTAAEPEKVEFNDAQQAEVNKIAAAKAFEAREQKRRADGLEAQLNELQRVADQKTRPDVSAVPDQYDDDYAAQLQARDEQLIAQARFDANQSAVLQQQEQAAQRQQQEQMNELNTKAEAYRINAVKQGVDAAKLSEAATTVGNFGLRQDVGMEMLSDEKGSLMTMYLAQNPQAIEALNTANNITLGSVYADIREKSSALSVKTTSTPDPVETQRGSGMPGKTRGPVGATYK